MQIYLIFDLINNKYSPWDQDPIGIKSETQHIIYQKLEKFLPKKDIHVSGLERRSLACKCVFYRTKNKMQRGTEFSRSWMQKWNTPTARAWRADEKNGVIFLVTLFTPWVMVIKLWRNGSFFVLSCRGQQNISRSLGITFTCTWKIIVGFRKWYG